VSEKMTTADLQQAIDIVQRNYKAGIDYTRDKDNTAICFLSKEAETVIKALSKAQEIQQAIDDGRAMIMPVKVGERVNLIHDREGFIQDKDGKACLGMVKCTCKGTVFMYAKDGINEYAVIKTNHKYNPDKGIVTLPISDFGITWWKEGDKP
jgi:hypothetical protein